MLPARKRSSGAGRFSCRPMLHISVSSVLCPTGTNQLFNEAIKSIPVSENKQRLAEDGRISV